MDRGAESGVVIDESTIGETPLVDLELAVAPTVLGKVEWFNLYQAAYGGGSVKSRIAKGMLDVAESAGDLHPGVTIIEPSSGNTGSEIARLGTARGYAVEIVMPDNASGGKIGAIQDAGATIHFVDADEGYDAVIDRCEGLIEEHPDRYFRPNQYANPHNPGTHEETTAREIWAQTDGGVTHFVAGVGTGGTVTGTGRGLQHHGEVSVVGFEPDEALHAIDGLKYLKSGDHYRPETYDETVLDDKVYVDTGAAYERARALRDRFDGRSIEIVDAGRYDKPTVEDHLKTSTSNGEEFLVGTSSGAAIDAVYQLDSAGIVSDGDLVVVILADRGDKYADIPLWEELFDP